MAKEKKIETQQKERFEIVEVPTQFGLGFKDHENEEVLDTNNLLLKIANEISEVKKALT